MASGEGSLQFLRRFPAENFPLWRKRAWVERTGWRWNALGCNESLNGESRRLASVKGMYSESHYSIDHQFKNDGATMCFVLLDTTKGCPAQFTCLLGQCDTTFKSYRNVGFYDVRRSLTEGKVPCAANFAAQAEARARERERVCRKVRFGAYGTVQWYVVLSASRQNMGKRPRGMACCDNVRRTIFLFSILNGTTDHPYKFKRSCSFCSEG